VKSLKIALPVFLFIFANFCFSQSPGNTQPASKSVSPAAASSAQPQAKKEKAKSEEDVVPPVGPNAIFPEIVAKIDGKPIFGRDLESIVRRELAAIGNPEWKNLREDYRGNLTYQAISLLINSKLIYQKALSAGIKATDEEVKEELQRVARTYGSDAEMNAVLATQLMDRAALQESLHESLTVEKYLNETIEKKIVITPEELGKYYAANPEKFNHPDIVRINLIAILAGETDAQGALAKQKAESILARVKKGEDFAKLAKENSIDPSASKGGDMGYISKDQIVEPEFANAAFSLAVGDAKLIKSQSRYIIFKVIDSKKAGMSKLDEITPQLTNFLKDEKKPAETTKLINQLRDQVKIEYLIPYKALNP
jgi:parvulin-like peptidyl-prolyl isomerase